MRRHRKARILATLGPASSSPEVLHALFASGVDAFRLNFSHGTRAEHKSCIEKIRALEEKVRRPIGVLADLQGHKFRIGKLVGGLMHLESGERLRLDLSALPGTRGRIPLPHPEIFAVLSSGVHLLLDDGRLRLKVLRSGDDFAEVQVVAGGVLKDHKGVNVPDCTLSVPALTDKDCADLDFALAAGVDWIALSFVQRASDLHPILEKAKDKAWVMAKLEKPSAIRSLSEIIACADGIMIARGDLGVELPPEDVPVLQKEIVRRCRQAGKPVVVATQMLESMTCAPTPTRAEASDVATAIYDGADAVMLSAETATGQYPIEVVSIMNRILEKSEASESFARTREGWKLARSDTTSEAISQAAGAVARTISAKAICCFSSSGQTAKACARERPAVSILALTPRKETARRLTLSWGCHPVVTTDATNLQDMVDITVRACLADGFGKVGERVVITLGVPFGTPGSTNLMRVARLRAL